MPRQTRRCPAGYVYHVLNRGNAGSRIFRKKGDARAFVTLLAEAVERVPQVKLLGWCLMPDHWHLVLWSPDDAKPNHEKVSRRTDEGAVSSFMRWLSNAHVRRYRQHYQNAGAGHVYQGRFKSFPVSLEKEYLLRVMRYVEGNALRAGKVEQAEAWAWSSLHHRQHGDGLEMLHAWPVARPKDWVERVNTPLSDAELLQLRTCVNRGRPYGSESWTSQTARELGLLATLRPRGRPKQADKPAR